jgi:hypothetical protein
MKTENLMAQLALGNLVDLEKAKKEIQILQEENQKLREVFPKILEALGNGSMCTADVSLEFIQEIPKEVELVLRGLKRNSNKIII